MRRNRVCEVVAVLALITLATHTHAQQAPQRLTIKDAIALALKNNPNVRVAGAQMDETAGTRERRMAALLPQVTGDTLTNEQNRNLAVSGISFPGVPTVVGPFSYYDFRVAANQPLIDRQAYHNWKASEKQEQATKLDYQDMRDLVVGQATTLYLASESAAAEVQSAQSRVSTSEALEELTRDQHTQGLATAIDVVRAQVQLARDRQNLLVARDAFQTSLLTLARFLGLSPGTPLELAEQLQFRHVKIPIIDQELQTALEARSDYRALFTQRESLVEQQKASHARYYPKLSISGDYGALGRNFGNMPGIGEIQGTVSIILFDRDRNGEQKELEGRIQSLNAQIDDMARGIEQDLRKAALDLDSTEQQVAVTEAVLVLAKQELTLAEDRFRNGVTDNIEVVTAQDALARAQDDRIAALANHAIAGMALARALGATEKNYPAYLGGP